MKKKNIAMLLAAALTLSQCAAVPVAAEDLSVGMNAQGSGLGDGSLDESSEPDEELLLEADEEVEEIFTESSAADETAAPEEDLIVEETEEALIEESAEETSLELLAEDTQYSFWYEFENATGENAMLQNSTLNVSTHLSKCIDNEEDIWETVTGYQLKIKDSTDAAYQDFGEFEVTVKGTEIEIVSSNTTATGDFDFSIEVLVTVDGTEKSIKTSKVCFSISEYIYVILPVKLTDTNGEEINPEVGDTVDIVNNMKPQIYRYETGKDDPVLMDGTDYKIVIDKDDNSVPDYDSEVWDWIGVENQELPILKRVSGASTYFALTAMQKDSNGTWQWIARREYQFDALPGYGEEDGDGEDGNGDEWHEDTSEENSGYELCIDFPDTIGNGAMLINSQMTIVTELIDTKNDNSSVTDYKLKVEAQSRLGTATVSNDGKNLLIKSGENTGSGYCYVSVWISDGAGGYTEAFKKNIYLSVTNVLLLPQTFLDQTGNTLNPKVGESIDLSKMNIGLYEYSDGKFNGIGDPGFKFIVFTGMNEEGNMDYDYDTDAWDMQTVPGESLPIMIRKTSNATWFAVTLLNENDNGEQVARKIYYFDRVEEAHTHTWKTGTVTKAATCTEPGIRLETCACGATKEVTLAAKGHTEVKDAAVAATALAQGKTAGSHCSVCGTVLKKQNAVAKLTATISLTAASLKMKTSQSTTAFKATGFAKGDYVTKVTSGNTKIVKVSNVKKDGTFQLTAAKKTGSATVTVTLASGKTKSFKVTVQKNAVKTAKITTSTKSLTIKKGESYTKLASSIVVAPVTSKQKITYSSSNKKVATVDSKGVIKAKKAGTAKITVKSGSKKAVVTVTVTGIKTTQLSSVPTSKTIKKGKTFTIKAIAAPKNTDEKITYKSSNKKIATVTSKGVVKGIRKGTATITVQSGSIKKTCKVTVK